MKNFSCILLLLFPVLSFAQTPSVLGLQEAIQIALQNNYDVLITRNETDISKINNSWANTSLLPTLGIDASGSYASYDLQQKLSNGDYFDKKSIPFSNLNGSLALNWRFFDGFKMFATKRRLEELEKIGELNLRKMMNETTYDIIAAYYNIIGLKQAQIATKEVISLYEERLKIANARFNLGSSPKPELLQAQVDLNEQQSSLLSIENRISLAKTDFNTLLARDPSTNFETVDSFILDKPIDFSVLQQKIDQQNPDMNIAQSNLAVLMQTKKEINSLRLPTATFNGQYNFIRLKNGSGNTLLNQTNGPYVGLGITVPIFSGLVVKRQLQAADINIKNQDIAIKQTKQQLHSSLTNAYLNYNNNLRLIELEEKNLALIKENSTISLERFKKLSITSLELRQVQLNYVDGQTRLINAKYQAKIAEAEMLLLAGEISN